MKNSLTARKGVRRGKGRYMELNICEEGEENNIFRLPKVGR